MEWYPEFKIAFDSALVGEADWTCSSSHDISVIILVLDFEHHAFGLKLIFNGWRHLISVHNIRRNQSWFLQAEANFFNHFVSMINCTFIFLTTTNVFCCFRGVMTQFELVLELDYIAHLSRWLSNHYVKHYTTCQHTNYQDTTSPSGFLSRLKLLQSRNVCAAKYREPKYCKIFQLRIRIFHFKINKLYQMFVFKMASG